MALPPPMFIPEKIGSVSTIFTYFTNNEPNEQSILWKTNWKQKHGGPFQNFIESSKKHFSRKNWS